MGKIKHFIFSVLLLAIYLPGIAQEVQVEGYFLKDSAMLGEKVGYVLKANYPTSLDILFPDSTYHFGSMEFMEKETFTSYTTDDFTQDSVVYFLSNFTLDSVKRYSLPVFEILRYDSISHVPADAELILKLTINDLPDVLAFQETNNYQKITRAFNYPYLILSIVIFTIIVVVVVLLFGKRIKYGWLIYLEKKKRKQFLERWRSATNELMHRPSLPAADELLGLWKSYMESLTKKPFQEWTATEIAFHLNSPDLLKDFRKIELIIYANRFSEDLMTSCDRLREISTSTFQQKIKKYHEHE